jgi:hypothetical protein
VRASVLAAAILVVYASAGCGATRSGPAPTKAQFIARADAICRIEEKKFAGVEFRSGVRSVALLRNFPRLIRKAAAIHEAGNAELESLPEPSGEAATIDRWLTARTVATTVESDLVEAPPGEEPATAARALKGELKRTRDIARGLGRSYGLGVCGSTE